MIRTAYHIGGHYEFDERVVHEAEADILADPSLEATVAADYLGENWIDAVPLNEAGKREYFIRPAPATRIVNEGDVLDLGNRHFEVFHLPGHSPGSICLWEEKTRTLFSGDVIYDGELLDELYHSEKQTYYNSLVRLRDLPVDTVHGGHYGSFGRERLVQLIDNYLAKFE